jgi:WD40 repeat protein
MEVTGQAMTRILKARELATVSGGGIAIADVAVASDGARLAACFGQTLVVVDWTSGHVVWRREFSSAVEAVAFAPDGASVAAACADGKVALIAVQTQRELGMLVAANGGFRDIAWSADGKCIAAGHYEPLVTLFDLAGTHDPKTLDPEIFSDEGRTAVVFSPDGNVLLSTAFNAILRWSLPALKRKKLALKEHAFMLDIAFAGDGRAIAGIAETEGSVALHLWTGDGARKLGKVELPGYSRRLAWSSDDSVVAVTEREAPGLSLWDPVSLGRSPVAVHGVEMAMSALAGHPAPLAFVTGSEQGQIVVWEPVAAGSR